MTWSEAGIDSAYRAAVREGWPLLIPALPFALVLGVAISDGTFGVLVGWSTSWIVFAGAAQLALVTLFVEVGPVSAIVSALVVNARHLMYSAALAPAFRQQPPWFRYLAPYVLIDQIFAVTITKLDADPTYFRRYYVMLGSVFWVSWQVTVGAGVLLGNGVPAEWGLGFAVPVLFIGLTVLSVVRRPALMAAAVGFVVAVVAAPLPNRSGLLVGAIAGVVAGAAIDRDPV
ncbi:MAG: AzlC family ABC transporter permease [Acidimicrobiia bacterium]|nr:AzlC family ABC transporter permease [Acidimicrobiia bacterium]